MCALRTVRDLRDALLEARARDIQHVTQRPAAHQAHIHQHAARDRYGAVQNGGSAPTQQGNGAEVLKLLECNRQSKF